jgi:hypothetical protein
MTLQFLTRDGCHLCEDAFAVLDEAARRAGVSVTVLDVDEDEALFEEYDFRVPVIRDSSGAVLAEGVIDPATIRRIVAEA